MDFYTYFIFGCSFCLWILKTNVVTSQGSEIRSKRQVQFGEWSPQHNTYNQRVQGFNNGQNRASSHSPSDPYHSRSSVIYEQGPSWSSSANRVKYSAEQPTGSSGERSSFRFSDENKSDEIGGVFESQERSNSETIVPKFGSEKHSSFRFSDEVKNEDVRDIFGSQGRSNSEVKQPILKSGGDSSFRFSDEVKNEDVRDIFGSQGRSNSEVEQPTINSGRDSSFRFSDEVKNEDVRDIFGSQGRSNSEVEQPTINSGRDSSFRFSDEVKNEDVRDIFGSQGRSNSQLEDSSKYGSTSSGRSIETPNWNSNVNNDYLSNASPRSRHSGRQSKVSAIFDSDKYSSFDSSSEKKPSFYSSEEVSLPSGEIESGRHLSPDTLATISETLGAINTVGRYLVNYTRGGMMISSLGDRYDTPPVPPKTNEDLPAAILTISKNVLGRNVTDSIAPLVRVLPIGKVTQESSINGVRSCTTPNGKIGYCEDLSNCPQLLLNLSNLRQSICFKSLFVPGVCCPRRNDPTYDSELPLTTTRRPLILTTQVPVQLVTQATTSFSTSTFNSIEYANEDCGVQEAAKFRVVGGEEALPGRWPWMAAIFLHGPRRTEFWCGGSLIGPKHILTAAHCTKDTRQRPFSARQFTVRLGDIDLRRDDEPSSPQTYRVVEVRAHPRFSRVGFYNDIAVLVLERPVRRSRYIIPVCLPPPRLRNNNFIGESPTVIGWGTTYYGGKESTVQRQVALPVWKNEECDRTYFQPITENFICAGLKEGGKDACQGDSGGPLILKKDGRWIQIGIVSFGNKCGEPGYPGVYTRITEYLGWIKDNAT